MLCREVFGPNPTEDGIADGFALPFAPVKEV